MEKYHRIYVKFRRNFEGMSNAAYVYRHTQPLEINTPVIVDSPSDGYVVAWVVKEPGAFVDVDLGQAGPELRYKIPKTKEPTKWIVGVVDDSEYIARMQAEERAAEIKKTLDKKLKDIEEFRKYQFLKEYDPEAASLMTELEGIMGIKAPPLPAPTSAQVEEKKDV